MRKTVPLYPDGVFFSMEELEVRLQFRFLPQNAFESPEDEEHVRLRGLANFESGEVSAESQELGKRFIQEIQSAYIPPVSVRLVDESVGYGLFAESDLPQGAYVGEYTGIVRRNDLRRYLGPMNNYCYNYPILDELGRSFVIDATQGNLTRFINHSFTPNLLPIHVYYEGFYHLIFLALKPIEKGTQLTYDYGKNYWYVRDKPLEF